MPEMQLRLSPRLLYGAHEINRLGGEAVHWGHRALLITERNLRSRAEEIQAICRESGLNTIQFIDTDNGHSTLTISDAVMTGRKAHVEVVIGLGGIKTVALAKAVAALIPSRGHVTDFYEGDIILKQSLPYIEVPTSGRNPFLFQDLCPVMDSRSRKTRFCPTPEGSTKMVIMDPTFLLGLEKKALYLSIMEAMFQAAEVYLFGRSSFFSDIQALAAINRYSSCISDLMENPETPYVREKICEAGIFNAFGQALVGLTPGIILSYTTADFFKLPRSFISTILFPYMLESLIYPATEKMEKLRSILSETGLEGTLLEQIRRIIGFFDLPSRLSDLGLKLGDLAAAADATAEVTAVMLPGVNKEEFFNILKEAF
jgi:alcohol dehydrogenase class IV